jgi:Gpi18-like mannosyltransferase
LGQQFLQDDNVAATAVLMFIANPASIHHSMLYTEALFTASSWLGLYCLYCQNSSLCASLAFAVSAATRSNGKHDYICLTATHLLWLSVSCHQQIERISIARCRDSQPISST